MTMRFLFTLLAILSFGNALAIDQIGIAYRYNGKKQRTPLGGVYIKVATSPNGVVSQEQNGQFVLKLKDIKMGDAMGNAIVQKTGMMVFNKEEVNRWHVQKGALVLIVCDANEFQKQKAQLITIGRNQAEKKYKQKLERLKAQNAKQQLSLDQYYAKLDSLEKDKENALAHMDEYADMFARIDESEIDTVAQKAMELFRQGGLDEAIRLFEQGNYLKKIDDALKVKAQAEDLRQKADSAEMLANKDIEEYLKSIEAQVSAYKMSNEWDKAGALLKGLADKLKTLDVIWDYAVFAQSQNIYNDAESYLKLYIEKIKSSDKLNEPGLAASINNLACLYYTTQRFNESEKMHKVALDIYKRLADANSQIYEPSLARSYNNIADLYRAITYFSESEIMYKAALNIRKRLAEDNPQVYESDLAASYDDLALLYQTTQRYSESEMMHKAALDIYIRLTETNPQAYELDLAICYGNLASLYYATKDFNESEKMYKTALDIYKHLTETNPQTYEPYLAGIFNNLASLYYATKDFNESEKMYKTALDIYKHLTETNPQTYEPYLAGIFNNLADLYRVTQRLNESETMHKAALEIYKHLAESNPLVYEPNLARSYNNLALLYQATQRFNESEKMYKSALEIRKHLTENNPQAYEPDLARSYNDLADLYSDITYFSESEKMYKAALDIYIRLAEDNPQVYKQSLTVIYNSLGFVYIFTKQFAQAEKNSKEAIKKDSTNHIAYNYLAAANLLQGKYNDAEKIYIRYKSELKELFLITFEAFADVGIIPAERMADVEKIKKMLNE